MHAPNPDPLEHLAAHTSWPSISIYLGTHRGVADAAQDRVRLKNLVSEACTQLIAQGMRPATARSQCAALDMMVDDPSTLRDATEGLALLFSEGESHIIHLDAHVAEQVVVGDRFFLRPMLAASKGERRFYALALDKAGCRLFHGDAAGIERIPIEGAPSSLAEEIRFDTREESLQMTTFSGQSAVAGTGRGIGMFHGHGGEKDLDRVGLDSYLRKVSHAVDRIVSKHPDVPLILLGVSYEIATYRATSTNRSLVDEHITGATDELPDHVIHTWVMEALAPVFDRRIDARLHALRESMGSDRVTTDIANIVTAAAAGRIDTLFATAGDGPYGFFDRDGHRVSAIGAHRPAIMRDRGGSSDLNGWDLIDLAAAETMLHGGDVVFVPPETERVSGVAAMMRY